MDDEIVTAIGSNSCGTDIYPTFLFWYLVTVKVATGSLDSKKRNGSLEVIVANTKVCGYGAVSRKTALGELTGAGIILGYIKVVTGNAFKGHGSETEFEQFNHTTGTGSLRRNR